jgi:hypothetical protein
MQHRFLQNACHIHWRKQMKKLLCCALVVMAAPTLAFAELCDYTPSAVIGGKKGAAASAATATGAGATVAAGVGLKAAGFYALPHAVTGATMLGSTAGGASAAGTVGIMGGTAGAVGTVAGALMSPFVIIPAATVAAGIVVFEGGCYLADW